MLILNSNEPRRLLNINNKFICLIGFNSNFFDVFLLIEKYFSQDKRADFPNSYTGHS
jgi:hypothetical protein